MKTIQVSAMEYPYGLKSTIINTERTSEKKPVRIVGRFGAQNESSYIDVYIGFEAEQTKQRLVSKGVNLTQETEFLLPQAGTYIFVFSNFEGYMTGDFSTVSNTSAGVSQSPGDAAAPATVNYDFYKLSVLPTVADETQVGRSCDFDGTNTLCAAIIPLYATNTPEPVMFDVQESADEVSWATVASGIYTPFSGTNLTVVGNISASAPYDSVMGFQFVRSQRYLRGRMSCEPDSDMRLCIILAGTLTS